MTSNPDPAASRDRNLIFGVIAVQLGLIKPAELAQAAAIWLGDLGQDLGQILKDRGFIDDDKRAAVEQFVKIRLKENHGEPRATLAALGGDGEVRRTFQHSIVVKGDAVEAECEAFGGVEAPGLPESPGPVRGARLDDDKITSEHPGRYTLRGEQGRGAYGRVMIAVDEHIGREVALKELLLESGGASGPSQTPARRSMEVVARFLREARLTGQLEHPGVVPVHEIARRSDGSSYYTMKLVRGQTLAAKLKAASLPDRLRLLPNFLDLAHAMAYAHSRGVIHRDLKPENIMVGEFGETVILDWGLAKVIGQADDRGAELLAEVKLLKEQSPVKTAAGQLIGTPAYMSPEQAEGRVDAIDERSDVWSLGVILYELLTGKTPFDGATAYEVMAQVISQPVPPPRRLEPALHPELAAIATKCLEREPASRYPNAAAIAADLTAYQAGDRVAAFHYTALYLLKKFIQRRWNYILFALVTLLVTVSGLGAWRVENQRRMLSEEKALSNELLYVISEAERADEKGDNEAAVKKFGEFIAAHPDHPGGYYAQAGYYWKKEEYQKALAAVNQALELDPKYAKAYSRRGSIYNNLREYDKALADQNRAIELDPKFSWAYNNRGVTHNNLREYGKALADYSQAIELDPKDAMAYTNRGNTYDALREYEKAIADYNKAIDLDPKFAYTYYSRGNIYKTLQEHEKALADYTKAIEIDPKFAYAYNGLAWLLATCPDEKYRDGNKAIELATKACELTKWENVEFLDTLAAAYAEAGNFPEAVKWMRKAIELLKGDAVKALGPEFEQRLDLFQKNQPYHGTKE